MFVCARADVDRAREQRAARERAAREIVDFGFEPFCREVAELLGDAQRQIIERPFAADRYRDPPELRRGLRSRQSG